MYSDKDIKLVPRRYVEYKQVKVFSELLTSDKAGKNKSANVAAIWKVPSGIIKTSPTISDVRVGQIQYFFTHTLQFQDTKSKHSFAYVKWFQDHPRKFHFGKSLIVSSTAFDSDDFSNIVPLSRLIARCAYTIVEENFDYGLDKFIVNIPMSYKIHF